MKIMCLYILSIILNISCSTNKTNIFSETEVEKIKQDTFVLLDVIDNNDTLLPKQMSIDFYEEKNKFINKYAVLLNNYKEGEKIPSFLFDSEFDSKNSFFLNIVGDDLQKISLRKLIFDKVVNKKLLSIIVYHSDKKLDIVPNYKKNIHSYDDIKYMNLSIRDLAYKRLMELENEID